MRFRCSTTQKTVCQVATITPQLTDTANFQALDVQHGSLHKYCEGDMTKVLFGRSEEICRDDVHVRATWTSYFNDKILTFHPLGKGSNLVQNPLCWLLSLSKLSQFGVTSSHNLRRMGCLAICDWSYLFQVTLWGPTFFLNGIPLWLFFVVLSSRCFFFLSSRCFFAPHLAVSLPSHLAVSSSSHLAVCSSSHLAVSTLCGYFVDYATKEWGGLVGDYFRRRYRYFSSLCWRNVSVISFLTALNILLIFDHSNSAISLPMLPLLWKLARFSIKAFSMKKWMSGDCNGMQKQIQMRYFSRLNRLVIR